MSQTNLIAPLLLSTVDAALIVPNLWTSFGIAGIPTNGIEGSCFMLRITNRCSNDVYISYGGDDRDEHVSPWKSIQVNFQTNSSISGRVAKVRKWTKLFVQGDPDLKGGTIYLAGYYNKMR